MDVRHAYFGTARVGYGARPDSPARDRRPNGDRSGPGVAGDRRRGFDLPHLHPRPQTKRIFGVDGGSAGDGSDGNRRSKEPAAEKFRDS